MGIEHFCYHGINGTIYVRNNMASAPIGVVQPIVRHSTTGMSWGYGGSEPANCALSILTDFFQRTNWRCLTMEEIRGKELYQKFKWEKISSQGEILLISSSEIERWLQNLNMGVVEVSL
jgi:hypothetical protein